MMRGVENIVVELGLSQKLLMGGDVWLEGETGPLTWNKIVSWGEMETTGTEWQT